MALAALPLFFLLEACRRFLVTALDPQTVSGSLLTLTLIGGLGAALILAAGRLTRNAEINAVVETVRERLRLFRR
jgi:hypothetical protein